MDSIPNTTKTIQSSKGEDVTLDLYKELECAYGLYDKACEGLDDCPPDPDVWLANGDQLVSNWESFKVTVIGQIEHLKTPEEQKKMMCDFLESSTCVYMDLMGSIWVNFSDHIKEHLPIVLLPEGIESVPLPESDSEIESEPDVEKDFPVPDFIDLGSSQQGL